MTDSPPPARIEAPARLQELKEAVPWWATVWSWAPPRLWCCPRCCTTVLTREAAPRCLRCGFIEGT